MMKETKKFCNFNFNFLFFTSLTKSENGQALLETIIFIPVFAVVFSSIAWFWRIQSVQMVLLPAAKYGTDLILHKNLNSEAVREELLKYLTKGQGSRLDRNKIKIKIKIGRVLPPPAFKPEFSYVEISYEIKIPGWMSSKFTLHSKSAVINDSLTTNFCIADGKNHS